MAGTVIPLMSKREYNFDNGSATVIVAKAIGVVSWTSGVLLCRVHETDVASGNTIDVVAKVASPSSDDPATDFVNATEIAKTTVSNSTTAPSLTRDDLVADFGAFLEITVVGTRGTGNCNAVISAELVLKD